MDIGRATLTSVEGSKMAEMFLEGVLLKKVKGGKVFIDRNPQIFAHVIDYLRTDRKKLPKNVSENIR